MTTNRPWQSTNAELLTGAEVAMIFRTNPATLRYWRHKGYGPVGLKVGKHVLYRRADVEAFLDQLAHQGDAPTRKGGRS